MAAKLTSKSLLDILSALVLLTVNATNLEPVVVGSQSAAFAQQQSQMFTANLEGSNEVPPVNTSATGTAHLQVSPDGKNMMYDISATNLNGFMMAHIHQGKARENGQPITSALPIGKGKITSSDLQGPLLGKQIPDLVNIIKSGAYVNVHTDKNQNGEIRGQLMSIGSS